MRVLFVIAAAALAAGAGSETQRPLAIVVIGGLATATFLSLLVLPVLYVAWFRPSGQARQDPGAPDARHPAPAA